MMLIQASHSALLIIDVQEKLMPFIQRGEALTSHCQWLINLAKVCAIPLLLSEQYPQGLGPTLPILRESVVVDQVLPSKVHFSCLADTACRNQIQSINKKQFIIAGIEAHVCVLQTVFDLLAMDKAVFVVAEAIGSRSEHDRETAIARMRQQGAHIVSKEMVFFEWMHRAGSAQFKQLSQQFLQSV